MYYSSKRQVEVPGTDLLSWVFGNDNWHDYGQPVTDSQSRRHCIFLLTKAIHSYTSMHWTPREHLILLKHVLRSGR